jgi:hypothetical protein
MTNSRFAVQKNRSPYIPPLPQNVRPCRSHWSWSVIRIVCPTQNSNLESHQVHLYLMCIKLLKILASILLLTEFFLDFVKASHLLYQSYAQIWTFLLAWYFSSVISIKFVSSFDTLSLISPLLSVYKHVFNGINLSFVIFNFSVIWNL